MVIEVGLLLCTAVLTVFAFLSTKRSGATLAECDRIAHALRKQAARHELIEEEIEALKKRQHKLAGRFFREKRDTNVLGDVFPDEPKAEPWADLDPVGEVQAMLDLQRAQSAPK